MNDRFGETVPLVGTAAMGALPPLNACGIYRTVKSIKDTPRILLDTKSLGALANANAAQRLSARLLAVAQAGHLSTALTPLLGTRPIFSSVLKF